MKLISLEVHGSREMGWSSEKLVFSNSVTQIFGDNGSGKTPIVKAIVFALGYNVQFRDDILARCDYVELEVSVANRDFLISRSMRSGFSIRVAERDGEQAEFISEREFSQFLLKLWGLDDPIVTTVRDSAARIYSHQVLPLYYLDQSNGYSTVYYTSQPSFIKNQYAEVMRLVNGLVPRNPFDKKRMRFEISERLEYLDRIVVRSERSIAELTSELQGRRRPVEELNNQLDHCLRELGALQQSGGSQEQVTTALDSRIAELHGRFQRLSRERAELEMRVRGFDQIRREVEAEADTLVLNEEARRVFSSFESICAKEGCGLFARSSESYGKSLLYLKDQTKDLERSSASCRLRIAEIDLEAREVSEQLAKAKDERAQLVRSSTMAALVNLVAQLTERVIELRRAIQVEQELSRLEGAFVETLGERQKVQAQLASLEGMGVMADLDLARLRGELKERIKLWLEILRTPNVGSEVEIDRDFNVTFGGQKLSSFSGSTLTRIILALRTSSFEVSVARKESMAPRFFILDTPRQQDISRDDLANYMAHLRRMSAEYDVQIIYSTTNHRYELSGGDVEWLPAFPGQKHRMFLGYTSSAMEE